MRLVDNLEQGLIYGLIGNLDVTTNHNNCKIVSDYKFKGNVLTYLDSPKASNSLKMVMLNDTYLDKTIKDLNESEIIKINLAKALIANKDYLVLDYFDKYLTEAEKADYKRLFKKIATNYHKTIILFTNDYNFLSDIASSIIYVDNQETINIYSKKDFTTLKDLMNSPILDFIAKAKSLNVDLSKYNNTSDILKAIYRIKG